MLNWLGDRSGDEVLVGIASILLAGVLLRAAIALWPDLKDKLSSVRGVWRERSAEHREKKLHRGVKKHPV